ncbi:MAG: type II toxin-antitoxin system VapC family toxin [Nitrososphaerales archaeon]
MKALLDTHAFLWWITNDHRMSARAASIIEDGANSLLLSTASAWEIVIKAQMGRLPLPGSPVHYVPEQMTINGIEPLPVGLTHALALYELPPLHRDPFDRLLVAQAQSEHLPILTNDPLIRQYDVEVLW